MNFIRHPKSNFNFGAPPDWDHSRMCCNSLPVRVGTDPITLGPVIRSYWIPSPLELDFLVQGGAVELSIHDRGMAPVSLVVVSKQSMEETAPSMPLPDEAC